MIEKVAAVIREERKEPENVVDAFTKFLTLEPGDLVAVNNTNHGLFGIGIITSGYKFELVKHDTGADNKDEFYSHYKEVEWKYTNYVKTADIVSPGETAWVPYGTVGRLDAQVPPYILRLIGEKVIPAKISYVTPEYLRAVINRIQSIRNETSHVERAHESLVEDFFCSLGYKKDTEIKYRQGRMDISIWYEDKPQLVVEVKRDWNLDLEKDTKAVQEAYNYAASHGIRYVVLTNGDYFALFDRLKGLSYSSNCIAEFSLTSLEEDDLPSIDRLKRENFLKPNMEELFRYLSECFRNK